MVFEPRGAGGCWFAPPVPTSSIVLLGLVPQANEEQVVALFAVYS